MGPGNELGAAGVCALNVNKLLLDRMSRGGMLKPEVRSRLDIFLGNIFDFYAGITNILAICCQYPYSI